VTQVLVAGRSEPGALTCLRGIRSGIGPSHAQMCESLIIEGKRDVAIQFVAVAVIGAVLFGAPLTRFHRTIGSMA
jgi:hypothetical protein